MHSRPRMCLEAENWRKKAKKKKHKMALGKSRAGKEVGKQIPRRGKRREMVLFWEVLHFLKKKPKNSLSSIKCELEFTSENSPWSPAKWHLCSFHHHFYFSFPTFFALTRSLLPFFFSFYVYFSRSGSASLPLCERRGCGQCRMSAPLPGSVTSFLPSHTPGALSSLPADSLSLLHFGFPSWPCLLLLSADFCVLRAIPKPLKGLLVGLTSR